MKTKSTNTALWVLGAIGLVAVGYWLSGIECEFVISTRGASADDHQGCGCGEMVVYGSPSLS